MKKTSKLLIAIPIAFYVLFTLTFCQNNSDKKNTKVIIGYQEIALYQHVFTAFEMGYFKEEGLDVELKSFASANQMMEAFLANKIDVLGLTNLQVALTIEGKKANQLKFINFLVWTNKAYPDYIITRKDANIKSLKELEGHTIGLHPGSAVKGFAQTVFNHFNLNTSNITTIELKPEIMQSTLIAGKVDAVYCMDPVATTLFLSGQCDTLLANPMQYIFPAPTPISGTAVSSKMSSSNPETIKRLIRALNKSIEFIKRTENNNEVAGYIAKYTPVKKEQTIKMNPSVYWTFEEINTDRVQLLANKFFELGIVEKKIETSTMLLKENFLDQK